MAKRKTTEQFILDAKKVHADRYDYSKTKYIKSHSKITITCKTHGDFDQMPYAHLNGQNCPKCTGTPKSSKDEFIKKARELNNNFELYDYSSVDYKTAHIPVEIYCKIHKSYFSQRPNVHLKGSGCGLCANEKKRLSRTQFLENSKRNGHAILYILRIFNENESFYKVGITTNTIENRFCSSRSMPYNYNIVYFEDNFENPFKTYDLEHAILRLAKESSYKPKIPFAGSTECFLDSGIIDFLTKKGY